jgi:two-component system alkaline phosphatase synthesis response regulator PhoP
MTYRILLCDDEVHILRAAEFKLSKAGFEVECASDGLAGWEAIQRRPPDILVTDLQMPRMTGVELARKVHQNPATKNLPILMLTAKGYELAQHDLDADCGILAVLTKPFSPRELLKTVEAALAATPAGKEGTSLAAAADGVAVTS